MNRTWMALGALGATALLFPITTAAASQEAAAQEGEAPRRGVLVPVKPKSDDGGAFWFRFGDDPSAREDEPFSPDHWLYQLAEPDLDERMRNFEEIVRLARRSPEAYEWLVERARDTADPELAWTAKLALRELTQHGNGLFFGPRRGWSTPLFTPGASQDELRESILRLFGENEFQLDPLDLDSLKLFGMDGSHAESHSLRVETGPDGVRVKVKEMVDGEEKTVEYEAESLEALLEAHPELEGRLGQRGGLRLRFSGDPRLDLEGLRLELDSSFEGILPPELRDSLEGRWTPQRGPRTDLFGVYVGDTTPEIREARGIEGDAGLYVDGVAPGTLAHELGIAKGDILLVMNGVALTESDKIGEVLKARAPDQDLVVEGLDARGNRWTKTWSPPVARDGR